MEKSRKGRISPREAADKPHLRFLPVAILDWRLDEPPGLPSPGSEVSSTNSGRPCPVSSGAISVRRARHDEVEVESDDHKARYEIFVRLIVEDARSRPGRSGRRASARRRPAEVAALS